MVIFEEAGKLLITKDSPFLKATSGIFNIDI